MKFKIVLSIMIMIGVALAIVFREVERKAVNRASAQIGGGCGTFTTNENNPCGNLECGLGTYTEVESYQGPGVMGVEPRSVPCVGSGCGSVPNIATAYYNAPCCDQDNDCDGQEKQERKLSFLL